MNKSTSFYDDPNINLVDPGDWDASKSIVAQIKKAILPIAELDLDDITVEVPNDMSHGDYSTNIALQLAQKESTNPKELAEKYKKALDESGGDLEAAVDALSAKGLAAAAKKSSRTAAEGW